MAFYTSQSLQPCCHIPSQTTEASIQVSNLQTLYKELLKV